MVLMYVDLRKEARVFRSKVFVKLLFLSEDWLCTLIIITHQRL